MSEKIKKRHPLLIYRRAMDRIWITSLVLGGLCLMLRYLPRTGVVTLPSSLYLILLTFGAGMSVFIAIFALVARNLAYVQVHPTHISLVTPFLRLRISYQRLVNARQVNVSQLFSRNKLGFARESFMDPFFGKNAVVLELKSMPVSPFYMHLFLAPQMFLPKDAGLILITNDWMGLMTQIDSARSIRRHQVKTQGNPPPPGFGLLKGLK